MWKFKHPSFDIKPSRGGRLEGRKIVLALTGSIAILQAPSLARSLLRLGAEVYPVMTPKAASMINPELLEWATGNPPVTEITGKLENIAAVLGLPPEGKIDLLLVAPCTANTLAKIAHGINDNAVTGFVQAAYTAGVPILIAPAMHLQLLSNPITQENLNKLRGLGFKIVEPKIEEGKAKMAPIEEIVEAVVETLTVKSLAGVRILVTAGPTREPLDPIRVITNRSSGKMGVAVAREAAR
ncbi:bifunctional phosphopantothenoylcysteine decarboxylase/phosphopantothenate--cysteine ligase CoaBC, partial [Candidatus Bathyarchaeota archaeon]